MSRLTCLVLPRRYAGRPDLPPLRTQRQDPGRHRQRCLPENRGAADEQPAGSCQQSCPDYNLPPQSVVSAALRAVGNIVTGDDIQTQVASLPDLTTYLTTYLTTF